LSGFSLIRSLRRIGRLVTVVYRAAGVIEGSDRRTIVPVARVEVAVRPFRTSLRLLPCFTRRLLRLRLIRSPGIPLRIESARTSPLGRLTTIARLDLSAFTWPLPVARLEFAPVAGALRITLLEYAPVARALGSCRLKFTAVTRTLRIPRRAAALVIPGSAITRLDVAPIFRLFVVTAGSERWTIVGGTTFAWLNVPGPAGTSWAVRPARWPRAVFEPGPALAVPLLLLVDIDGAASSGIFLRKIHVDRFEEGRSLAIAQIPPVADRQSGHGDRPDTNTGQLEHRDVRVIHDAPDDVIHPLVERNGEHYAVAGFAEQAEFVRHNLLAFDFDAPADPLDHAGIGPFRGQDVILLFEPETRMHNPVGQLAVVREQEEPFGFTIEPANRVEPFARVDQIHHRASVAFVAGGGNEAAGLVEHDVATLLRTDHLAVDANDVGIGVRPGTEFGNRFAVDRNATGQDHFFRHAAGCDASCGKNALQALHNGWVSLTSGPASRGAEKLAGQLENRTFCNQRRTGKE
jgi:hypothetical protein